MELLAIASMLILSTTLGLAAVRLTLSALFYSMERASSETVTTRFGFGPTPPTFRKSSRRTAEMTSVAWAVMRRRLSDFESAEIRRAAGEPVRHVWQRGASVNRG